MPDAPHRMLNGVAIPLTQDEITARAAEESALAAKPAPSRLIAKTRIYRRATDQEMATLATALAGLSARQRLMWTDAEGGLVYVEDVQALAVQLFGAQRAAALLAP